MTSEIAAAARLRRVATSTFEEVYGSGPFAFNPIAEDNRIVSAAALAMGLFREDGGERITREWLLSEGWYGDGSLTRNDVGFWLSPGGAFAWNVFAEVYDLGSVSTRGQLRLLLKSLGIEVDNKP